ncbi:hypothetical protein D3C84_934320 [compost metagenome]
MQGASGAVKSASAIVHSAALADPAAVTAGKVDVEGDIALVGSYAAPTALGIGLAAQLSAGDFTIDVATADTFIVKDKTKSACLFSYKMAAADSVPTITTTALTAANCD